LDVRLDGVVWDGDRPEQAAGRDSRVVVVDLGVESRVNLTLVDVESDEGEGAAVAFAVGADVDAFHEAIVRTEVGSIQRLAVVNSYSRAFDVGHADNTFEVEDRRDIRVRDWKLEVKQDLAIRPGDRCAVWNWSRGCYRFFSLSKLRHPDARGNRRPARESRRSQEIAPGERPFPEVRVSIRMVGDWRGCEHPQPLLSEVHRPLLTPPDSGAARTIAPYFSTGYCGSARSAIGQMTGAYQARWDVPAYDHDRRRDHIVKREFVCVIHKAMRKSAPE